MAMNYSEKLREPQSPGKEWSEVIIKEAALAQPLFRFDPSLRDVWVEMTDMVFRYRRTLSEERWPLASVAVTM